MLNLSIRDHKDGSNRLFAAACRAVEYDLNDCDALEALHRYAAQVPFPTNWTDQQLLDRLRDAERKVQRGSANGADSPQVPQFKSARQLLIDHPMLREPVIDGLLRRGETMNIIAASKTGKSWLVNDLALAMGSGRPWLNRFPVSRGDVLILDNELHGETTASRLPKVASARGMLTDEWADALCIENMRGRWTDIFKLSSYFAAIQRGRFKVIILDAFYRFMPSDTDENDNGTLASVYNQLDRYATFDHGDFNYDSVINIEDQLYWLDRLSNELQTPPTQAGEVSAYTDATNTIDVSWIKVAGSEGYHIYRSSDGSNFTLVGTVNDGLAEHYLDTGLAPVGLDRMS